MVILNKIYTKTGDDGTTALATGERKDKNHPRIKSFGAVDETNAAVGMARAEVEKHHPEIAEILKHIQNDLFDLGADLAATEKKDEERLRIASSQTTRLESDIDRLNAELSPLRSFVLPGGSESSARLHVARAAARKAERAIIELERQTQDSINPECRRYMNRLSDFLFVAARFANDKGEYDILWIPGQNR